MAHQLSALQTTVNGTTTHNVSYSYNANGDRIGAQDSVTSASTTYGYNQNDQLTSFTNGIGTSTYSYDGSGLRASKTVGGTAEGFVWNLAEGLPTIIQDGSMKYVTGPGGLPLEQVASSGAVLYYYQDQLGSTRGLVDGSGTTAATYTYDAYGNVKSSTGSVSNPFQYAGQYTDSESGLQYLRARYYDPSTEQFLSVDPLVDVTHERYGYAGGDALNAGDPSGSCTVAGINLPFGSSNACSDDVGAAAYNTVDSAFNATAEPAFAPSNGSDLECRAENSAKNGTGRALPFINGVLDNASTALVIFGMMDGVSAVAVTVRSVSAGNYIAGAWFRVEAGPFAGTGGRALLHFHLNPFPGSSTELMRYHLPYQWKPWIHNAIAIFKRRLPTPWKP